MSFILIELQPKLDKHRLLVKGTQYEEKFEEFSKDIWKVTFDTEKFKEYPGSKKGLTAEEDKEEFANYMNKIKTESFKEFENKYIKIDDKESKTPKSEENNKEKKIHVEGTDIHYMQNYDQEYRLKDCDDMPTWAFLKDDSYSTLGVPSNYTNLPHTGGTAYDADDYYDANESDEEIYKHFNTKPKTRLEELINAIDPNEKQRTMTPISPFPLDPSFRFEDFTKNAFIYACFRQFVTVFNFFRSKHRNIFAPIYYSADRFYEDMNNKKKPLPSLFAYYETLPAFVRNQHCIKEMVINLEVILTLFLLNCTVFKAIY